MGGGQNFYETITRGGKRIIIETIDDKLIYTEYDSNGNKLIEREATNEEINKYSFKTTIIKNEHRNE